MERYVEDGRHWVRRSRGIVSDQRSVPREQSSSGPPVSSDYASPPQRLLSVCLIVLPVDGFAV